MNRERVKWQKKANLNAWLRISLCSTVQLCSIAFTNTHFGQRNFWFDNARMDKHFDVEVSSCHADFINCFTAVTATSSSAYVVNDQIFCVIRCCHCRRCCCSILLWWMTLQIKRKKSVLYSKTVLYYYIAKRRKMMPTNFWSWIRKSIALQRYIRS